MWDCEVRDALEQIDPTSCQNRKICPIRYSWRKSTCMCLFRRMRSTICFAQACMWISRKLLVHYSAKNVKDFRLSLDESLTWSRWYDRKWAKSCCEKQIGPKQLAFGSWNSKGYRRQQWNRTDQFGSIQGIWLGEISVLGGSFED